MTTGKSVTLIAALARNRAIGRGGQMPWHLPGELQHFKRSTMGKPIVMGRKTWEAIGRPLPGRQNIVLTRARDYLAEGAVCVTSLQSALALAEGEEVMIIGGGELYRLALPIAVRMLLTVVDCSPEADTWFPGWDESEWRLTRVERFPADDRNPLAYEIRELRRVTSSGP
jgi:dihydrofolate reductase